MLAAERTEQWLVFFKALADPSRIKIVGLLAGQPYSVEEIAAHLRLSSATVSHHLKRLLAAGLVEARSLQYYNVYALRPDTLRGMAEQLANVNSFQEAAGTLDFERYDHQVLGEYVVRGRLKTLPSQLKKRQVILEFLAREFQTGKRYSERRVNEILKGFHPDYAKLRQELVSARLLAYSQGQYWRPEPASPDRPPGSKSS